MPKTYFISDLHLDEGSAASTQLFKQFVAQCQHGVDSVYILGDLFNTWIGDDIATAYHHEIMQALRSLTTAGINVYVMHGNRDFLLAKRFRKATQCILINDPTLIILDDTPILLTHGDHQCAQDKGYQLLRKIVRNPIIQTIFLSLPASFRRAIANQLRNTSQQQTRKKSMAITDVTHSAITQLMHQYRVNTLIHGHTHRPQRHQFMLNGSAAERIVLGDWHETAQILCYENRSFELVEYR